MVAGTITTGSFPRSLLPGVNAWVGMAYKRRTPVYDKIFEISKSNRNYEFDVMTVPTGLVPVKGEGDNIVYDSMIQSFETRYVHTVYASGIVITREEVEDDLYGIVAEKRAKALGDSFAVTKEIVCSNILNFGFTGGIHVGGDGQPLFSTSHPIAGGTYSNRLAVNSDLSESALEQALIDIDSLVDQRGKPILVESTMLIVPKELKFEASRILKSDFRVATADNDINAMKMMGLLQDVLVDKYLTDPDAWFIKTDVRDGLRYFDRRSLEVATDDDFDTENMKFKVTERYSVGWTDARAIFGSPGA
jgi:hypothetical protein